MSRTHTADAPADVAADAAPIAEPTTTAAPTHETVQMSGNPSTPPTFERAETAPAPGVAREDAPAGAGAGAADPNAPVPYEQFKQLTDQLAALQGWQPIIDALTREGYTDPQAVQAALDDQWKQQHEAAENDWRRGKAAELDAAVRSGQLDPRTAQQQYALALQQRQLETDRRMYQDMRIGMELGTALQEHPLAAGAEGFIQVVHQATGQPIKDLTKSVADFADTIRRKAIDDYQREKEKAAVPSPEGGGGSMPVRPTPSKDAWKLPYSRLFGIGRGSS